MGGIGQGQDVEDDEELRTNYVSSDEEGGVKMLDGNRYGGGGGGMLQLQSHARPRHDPDPAPAAAPARRFRMSGERRKSERRASKLKQIQSEAGMSDGDEVLYSGDEYQTEYEYGEGVKRAETEISHARAMQPQPQQSARQVREEGKERQGHGTDTGGVAVEEEEELYSDGEYETDYRDSDDD
jgi:hypothetical protein